MKRYKLMFEDGALSELDLLHEYVTRATGKNTADRFLSAILSECESLCVAPKRGIVRSDLAAGTRLVDIARGCVSITFHVSQDTVTVASVYYAGRNR